MPIPQHFLHVYQRPKQGSSLLKRHETYNYQHTITNQGWFDTASCDIAVRSQADGQSLLNDYLGCLVAIYVDNPAEPIWEGLINRITYNAGGAAYTASLDELANRVTVVYTGAANAAAETAAVNDTGSQAIYGIKQDQLEFGADPSAGTLRTVLANTMLAQRAYPQTSISQAQGQTNLVHLELIGIFHTLEWVKFFTGTTAATTAAGTNVGTVVGTNPNGATFFNNTDLTKISANATTVPSQERGASYWERLMKIASAGDSTNYWVCGVLPTNRNTGKRAFYYRQANANIDYIAYQKDGLIVRNPYGQIIRPWLVTPDHGIRVQDAVIGYNSASGFDPRQTYIQSIQYDANSQVVQWFGADDTTARGAFMLKRGFKPLSRAFGAPLRTIVT